MSEYDKERKKRCIAVHGTATSADTWYYTVLCFFYKIFTFWIFILTVSKHEEWTKPSYIFNDLLFEVKVYVSSLTIIPEVTQDIFTVPHFETKPWTQK